MRKLFQFLLFSFFIAMVNPALASDDIPAYYTAGHMSSADAAVKLKAAGFDVVFEYKIGKKKDQTSILFTNDALKKDANKKDRAFGAILRLLVDDKKNVLSINNPIYFEKAFLQDDYNQATATAALDALKKAFGTITASKDKLEADDIAGYHFMMGMPYYDDMIEIGSGKCNDLVDKAKKYKKGKGFLFELKLADNRYLIGYKLGKKTAKFPKKIGFNNAQLLPYLVMIEDGKAKILAPKYYLAISYPLLSMGEFTTVATVPGAIEKDLKKPFK